MCTLKGWRLKNFEVRVSLLSVALGTMPLPRRVVTDDPLYSHPAMPHYCPEGLVKRPRGSTKVSTQSCSPVVAGA